MKRLLLALFLLPSLAWADYATTVLNQINVSGKVGWYYRLGETSGTTYDDIAVYPGQSGPNPDGTWIGGGTTVGVTGLIAFDSDKAATLDGGVAHYGLTISPPVGSGNQCSSHVVWVKPASIRQQGILAWCDAVGVCTSGYLDYIAMDSSGHFTVQDLGGTVTGSTVATTGTTYRVERKGCASSKGDGKLRLYVNNTEEGTATNGSQWNGGGYLYLGVKTAADVNTFDGTIDEVMMVMGATDADGATGALTADQRTAQYNCGTLGTGCDGTNPGATSPARRIFQSRYEPRIEGPRRVAFSLPTLLLDAPHFMVEKLNRRLLHVAGVYE